MPPKFGGGRRGLPLLPPRVRVSVPQRRRPGQPALAPGASRSHDHRLLGLLGGDKPGEWPTQMGIVDGDLMEVESPSGTLQAPAYVYPAMRPDVVAMPLGQGHTLYGRYAQNRGVNPISILSAEAQDGTDELAWAATRVRIRKTGQKGRLFLFQPLTKEVTLDGLSVRRRSRE